MRNDRTNTIPTITAIYNEFNELHSAALSVGLSPAEYRDIIAGMEMIVKDVRNAFGRERLSTQDMSCRT